MESLFEAACLDVTGDASKTAKLDRRMVYWQRLLQSGEERSEGQRAGDRIRTEDCALSKRLLASNSCGGGGGLWRSLS